MKNVAHALQFPGKLKTGTVNGGYESDQGDPTPIPGDPTPIPDQGDPTPIPDPQPVETPKQRALRRQG